MISIQDISVTILSEGKGWGGPREGTVGPTSEHSRAESGNQRDRKGTDAVLSRCLLSNL